MSKEIILADDEKNHPYFVDKSDIEEKNSHFYFKNIPYVYFDRNSIDIFMNRRYRAFIAVPTQRKTVEAKPSRFTVEEVKPSRFTVEEVKPSRFIEDRRYVLKPIGKYDTDERTNISSNIYVNPQENADRGGYGSITLHPTENVAVKTFSSDYSPDMIKELAIYRLLSKFTCVPEAYGFENKTVSMDMGRENLSRYTKKLFARLAEDEKMSAKNEKIIYNTMVPIMHRLIRCMRLISSQGIIHYDLKPQNIIASRYGHIQIIDWGLAEIDYSLEQDRLKYTTTRTLFYTAPEILSSLYKCKEARQRSCESRFTNKIDIYAIGLIFFAMVTGNEKPYPEGAGGNSQVLIQNIMKFCDKYVANPKRAPKLYELSSFGGREVEDAIRRKLTDQLATTCMANNADFIDLLTRMLLPNPKERLSYDQILRHAFFQKYEQTTQSLDYIKDLPIFINNVMPNVSDIYYYWTKLGLDRTAEIRTIQFQSQVMRRTLDVFCLAIQLADLTVYKMVKHNIAPRQNIGLHSYFIAACLFNHCSETTDVDGVSEIVKILRGNILIPSLYSYYTHKYGELSFSQANEVFHENYMKKDIYENFISKIPVINRDINNKFYAYT